VRKAKPGRKRRFLAGAAFMDKKLKELSDHPIEFN